VFRRTDQRVQGRRTLFYDRPCDTPATTLPAHLWKGILTPDKAQAIAMHGDDVVGTRHRYGKGEAVWLPSLIELGGWHGDNKGVADFYGTYCRGQIDRAPLHFSRPADGVLMRLMESPSQRLAVLVNKRPHGRRNRAFAAAASLGAPVMRRSVAQGHLRQARSRRVCGFPVGQTGGMMQKTGIFVVAF